MEDVSSMAMKICATVSRNRVMRHAKSNNVPLYISSNLYFWFNWSKKKTNHNVLSCQMVEIQSEKSVDKYK